MCNVVGFLNASLDDMTWIVLFQLLSKWFQFTIVNYGMKCLFPFVLTGNRIRFSNLRR